jgi:RNAse (barnase) inhibitor barstar
MSGLAAVLAGRVAPGIYRWHGAFPTPEVQHAVEHAGWRFAYVDGWHGDTKQEFLDAVGEALDFPEDYGHNFDSLGDCLLDVTDDTILLWDGWGPLARADEQAFSVALSVLGTRVNAEREGAFAVLLRGDGPDVPGVPSLD